MTFLCDARYSIVLLRPKSRVRLLTKVQKIGFVWGNKWAFEILAILFLKDEKAPDNRTFFS